MFDAATLPKKPADHTDPFARAMARTTDPDTSHAAAASVTDLTGKQSAVLRVLTVLTERNGGATDEQIADAYFTDIPWEKLPEQSPSGLRTRRNELWKRGLVRQTEERRRNRAGRRCVVWEAVEGSEREGRTSNAEKRRAVPRQLNTGSDQIMSASERTLGGVSNGPVVGGAQ